MNRNITITNEDRQRLGTMLLFEQSHGIERQEYLQSLEAELEIARGADSSEVPHDVVTMNSVVEIYDLKSGETDTYTLVYPERADINTNRISVLAPMGTAILGCRVGDMAEVKTPSGVRRIRIDAVIFQPERSANRQTGAKVSRRPRRQYASSDSA